MKKRYLIAGISGLTTAAIVTKLLMRPSDVDWEHSRETIFHAEYSHFVEVDGVRVHYQEAGSPAAPPLMLIHGFCSSTLVWSKVFLQIADAGFHVIAPDLLGYGYSSKPRDFGYTIDAQAQMIVGLLKKLGIQKATLVGSSYGGAVAASIGLDYPESVEKLVLVGPVTNNKPTKYLLMRFFGSPLIGDFVSPFVIGSRRLLRMRMKRVYDRHECVLDERRVYARHLPLRGAATHRAIIRTVRRWDADRIQRDAHLINQQTLLLWGENDTEVPLQDGEHLQSEIKDSRLVVFRECGHLPHEEFPKAFTEIVVDFCSDLLKVRELRLVGV